MRIESEQSDSINIGRDRAAVVHLIIRFWLTDRNRIVKTERSGGTRKMHRPRVPVLLTPCHRSPPSSLEETWVIYRTAFRRIGISRVINFCPTDSLAALPFVPGIISADAFSDARKLHESPVSFEKCHRLGENRFQLVTSQFPSKPIGPSVARNGTGLGRDRLQ